MLELHQLLTGALVRRVSKCSICQERPQRSHCPSKPTE